MPMEIHLKDGIIKVNKSKSWFSVVGTLITLGIVLATWAATSIRDKAYTSDGLSQLKTTADLLSKGKNENRALIDTCLLKQAVYDVKQSQYEKRLQVLESTLPKIEAMCVDLASIRTGQESMQVTLNRLVALHTMNPEIH